MVDQANPKNHPGGDHGALFKLTYQFVCGPLFIKKPPIAKAVKFNNKNNNMF